MRFSTFILRNVLRRPIRTTLTIAGMAIAVAAVVALVGLADGLSQSMLRLYVDRGVSLIVTRKDAVNPMSATLPAALATEIEKLPNVEATCPGLLDLQTIEECGADPIMVQGWPAGNYMFDQLVISPGGRVLAKEDLGKSVLIGTTIAEIKHLGVGNTITISDEKFQIVGVYKTEEDMENGMVVMLLEDAQKVFGKKNQMTGCTVKLKDRSEAAVAAVKAKIEGEVAEKCDAERERLAAKDKSADKDRLIGKDSRPAAGTDLLKGKILAKSPSDFVKQNSQVRAVSGFAWMTSAVALIIGGIGVLNTMFMSVFERTREIGILRAIGWRPRRVMRMILMESVLLSIGGGIFGTAAGLGLISMLSRFPIANGIVHAAITPFIVMEGFAIAVLVGVLGAAYPAYRGSRLLPTEALRHE